MRNTPHFCAALFLAAAATPACAASGPDSNDLRLCAFAASMGAVDLDRYLVVDALLDVDGDGSSEHLSVTYVGTAGVPEFTIARADGTAVAITWADQVDAVDDDRRWVGAERWLIVAGRAYGLRFDGWGGHGTGYLHYISRFDSGFVEQPLCKFEPQVASLIFPLAPGDRAVCEAVAGHSVAYTPVTRTPPMSVADHQMLAAVTEIVGQATVDFTNTGSPVPLSLYRSSSTAGAGCDLNYYDRPPADARLAAMQGLDFTDVYPRRTCLDAEPRWFTFNGATYLETQSVDAEAPHGAQSEYHFVDTIQDGLPRRVCEASYTHGAPKLIGVWREGNWAPPPADIPGDSP